MKKYFLSLLYVSTLFFLYQGIANIILNIISELTHQHGNDWSGPVICGIFFIGMGSGSLYNAYITKYQKRYTLFIGSFGNTIFVSLGLIFMKLSFTSGVLVMLIGGSLVSGLVVSMFYNTLYNYVDQLGKRDNEEIKYFSILMVSGQASSLFGSVLSALLIGPLGQFYYVLTLALFIFFVSIFFLGIKSPSVNSSSASLQSSSITNEPQQAQQTMLTTNESSQAKKSCCNLDPYHVGPCFAFTGIMAVFTNIISIIVYRTFDMDDESLNRLTFIILIFQGLGEALGGIVLAIFSSRMRSPAKAYLAIASGFIFGMLLILVGSYLANSIIISVGSFVVGACDCMSLASGLALAGYWEKDGFTAYTLLQSYGVTMGNISMIFLPNLFIGMFISILYAGCNISLLLYIRGQKKNL